jgi:preprotein translocase subunit YajC
MQTILNPHYSTHMIIMVMVIMIAFTFTLNPNQKKALKTPNTKP